MYFFIFIILYYIYGFLNFVYIYMKNNKKKKIIDTVKDYNDDNNETVNIL